MIASFLRKLNKPGSMIGSSIRRLISYQYHVPSISNKEILANDWESPPIFRGSVKKVWEQKIE